MNYQYTCYGLSLRSDVSLPGLTQASSSSASDSVRLTTLRKPEWADAIYGLSSRVILSLPAVPECADPTFVAREYDGGRFFQLSYGDGTEFVLDEKAENLWGATPLPIEDLTTYLMGPVLGFVLRRKGVTTLHASAVCIGDRAIAISGPAAGGKSTTAAAMGLRGVPVLCEDIAALAESSGGQFFVQSGYPRVCLWPDSVAKLFGSEEAMPDLTPTWNKKFLGLDGVRAKFAPAARPLAAVYLLGQRSDEASAPRLTELTTREALLELVQNTYMNKLLDREQRAAEFESLSRLVTRVPCKRVIPHADSKRILQLCELLEQDACNALNNQKRSPVSHRR